MGYEAARSKAMGYDEVAALAASYEHCRAVHRAHGRTYYLATRLLPRWKRRHVHALYGFTRHTDDIVDTMGGEITGGAVAARARALDDWAARFTAALLGRTVTTGLGAATAPDAAAPDDPVLPAVLHTVRLFDLELTDFAAFLRSMAMDLTISDYETYDDLLDYMAGSGAAIGSMMLPILDVADQRDRWAALAAAREPARQLGLAFQLTNFIRDVGEDLDRGRIYLPAKDLADFGITPDELRARVATPAVRRLIAFEVERAREHYARAAPGIPLLEPRSQACIRAAYRLYGGILDEVVAAGHDVFARRATVPSRRRLAVAAACLLTPPGRPA